MMKFVWVLHFVFFGEENIDGYRSLETQNV